ncbi:MAG: amino acid permease [Verrucomicrobia bacterium]|nr:amino acid permease [Verrucomicrobiota bacterium]
MKKGLFLRKPMKAAEGADSLEEGHHELKRHLKAFHLVSIGIGAIIGAGIFVITGQAAAEYAGPSIVMSFIIAAIVCVFAGLCYAELSSMIPVSGGSYSYAYVAMGEFPAWIVGWSVTAQYLISASTVAVGWSGYFSSLMKDFGIPLSNLFTGAPFLFEEGWKLSGTILNLPAMILVFLVGVLISVGIKAAARFNHAMVFIKLATVILFIIIGIPYIQSDNWLPFIPENTGVFGEFGISGTIRAAGLLFFAYLGFDTVSTLAQEAVNPQKDLPKGILGSLFVCTLAYIATSLVLTGVVNYTLLGVPDPMSVALNVMGAKFFWLKFIVKLAIIAGLASVVLVQLLGQSRVFFAMSRDGLLPQQFSQVNKSTKTPVFSSVITCLLSMIVSGLFSVNILGQLVSMTTLFIFAMVCLGVLILRYTHPEFKRSFKVPLVPYIPLVGMLVCLGQMCFLPLASWVLLLGWLAVGLAIYFRYGIRHSKLRRV